MNLNEVLFVGGNWPHLSSVKIRCVDLAQYIGCDYQVNVHSVDEISPKYKAYICVKAKLSLDELENLSRRGLIVWDIIDRPPPECAAIKNFIASTARIRAMFSHLGRVEVIPHYHCNLSSVPNAPNIRRPGWIGHGEWYPDFGELDHDAYDVRGMNREEVAQCYRRIGIGLNIRSQTDRVYLHGLFNSGIKLINCIGFAIPSVSGFEPAYQEFGDGCTVFSGPRDCALWVQQLQADDRIYNTMRERCIEQSERFHISTISQQYKNFIESLQ